MIIVIDCFYLLIFWKPQALPRLYEVMQCWPIKGNTGWLIHFSFKKNVFLSGVILVSVSSCHQCVNVNMAYSWAGGSGVQRNHHGFDPRNNQRVWLYKLLRPRTARGALQAARLLRNVFQMEVQQIYKSLLTAFVEYGFWSALNYSKIFVKEQNPKQ